MRTQTKQKENQRPSQDLYEQKSHSLAVAAAVENSFDDLELFLEDDDNKTIDSIFFAESKSDPLDTFSNIEDLPVATRSVSHSSVDSISSLVVAVEQTIRYTETLMTSASSVTGDDCSVHTAAEALPPMHEVVVNQVSTPRVRGESMPWPSSRSSWPTPAQVSSPTLFAEVYRKNTHNVHTSSSTTTNSSLNYQPPASVSVYSSSPSDNDDDDSYSHHNNVIYKAQIPPHQTFGLPAQLPQNTSNTISTFYGADTNHNHLPSLTPTDLDVLKGRGGRNNQHPGNQRYLAAKSERQEAYRAAPKRDKKHLSQSLVDFVHSWGGRFLQQRSLADGGGWYELENHAARTKAAQALSEISTPESRRAKRAQYPRRASDISGKTNKRRRV